MSSNIHMKWVLGSDTADFFGKDIKVSNNIRNFDNGLRKLGNPEDVVYTIPTKSRDKPRPYMPRAFPVGLWKITKVSERQNPYTAPYFISTNAIQLVEVWTIEDDGTYGEPTGTFVEDTGYGIHSSTSSTTLGCLKVQSIQSLLEIVSEIQQLMKKKEEILFECIAGK